MIENDTIDEAARVLANAAPGSKVILFGSYARGNPGKDSDLDLIVIEPKVTNRRSEMARLRRLLMPLGIPADVMVVSKSVFQEWRDTPNTVIYEAAREGRVLHEES